MSAWRQPGLWLPLLLVAAAAIWPAFGNNASLRETIFTMLMSVALASSLNILLGYTGYVNFGSIVFFGLGGYLGFYTVSALGWHLLLAVPIGGVAAATLALLLGSAVLRLRGAYFALATIGINEAMKALVINLDFLGGPTGMNLNFSIYQEYGGPAQALWLTYWALAVITLLVIVVSYLVKKSKFGLGLMAIREDEDAAEVMGVVAPRAKTTAYVISAFFPGLIGVLFFFKNGIIEPESAFRLHLSVELLVMVMLGGAGTVLGPVLGAAFYQRLRGLLLTSELFKNTQLVVAGVLLLLIVLFIPAGAVGWLRHRFAPLRRLLE
ncbi:MAG: branched-chain amino acid ABC transporter permease [Caldilineaceae bacterium]|jgi:branched-chain amino acid transport system permease protein|nr:branched-chain amino acid ABC transporter permease [Caldilineaceae bacterium]